MAQRRELDELIGRLAASVGEAVFEDAPGLGRPPEPRETWIDLQQEAVAVARDVGADDRRRLAAALLDAILHQPSYGASNRVSPDAFALVLDAAPDLLEASLDPAVGHLYGGKRYLREHIWAIPGTGGARWLGVLARVDDVAANFLLQDMGKGLVPAWREHDWPDRLDAIAALPAEPRPGLVTVLFVVRPPRGAMPAFVRLVLAHGRDERDPLVRLAAGRLRAYRDSAEDAVDLVDWEARARQPELFRWLLELGGGPGERQQLVAAAVEAGALPARDAAWLSAPLARPAWADGEVPWEVDAVETAGELRLPEGHLAGGDPFWTGGAEGLPWTLDVPAGSFPVTVVVASHPLAGRECAALEVVFDGESPVETWTLVRSRCDAEGYAVEVGAASFGTPAAYDAGVVFADAEGFSGRPRPAWATADAGEQGTIVLGTVGPQHQMCRTWVGTATGRPVAVVTDLGLLGLDLARAPARPWR